MCYLPSLLRIANLVQYQSLLLRKIVQMWYLLHICCNLATLVNPFFRPVLGFHLHPLVSVIIPTKRLTFLGFNLDSGSMTVSPTEQKVLKTLKSCKKLKAKQNPLISEVAEVIGIVVSNFSGTQVGQLYYQSLEHDKTNSLICSKGNYNAHMKLSSRSMIELDWWISNMSFACKNIQPLKAKIQLQTDA